MSNKQLISILRQNRLLRTQAELSSFESALATLTRSPNPNDLLDLFLVFTDACEQQEVMWGLLHFVESFGMERQLQAMVQALPSMIEDASEWAEIFHCRVLNDEQYRTYYKGVVSSQHGPNRQAVEQVLNKIRADDAAFAPRVDYVLSK
jgi:hypothetical protein